MASVIRVITVACIGVALTAPVWAGVGEDWESANPFTLMALSGNYYNNWDATEYQAAGLNTTLNWEKNIPMVVDSAAAGLPWIYNVQANPAGLTTALQTEIQTAYNTNPSGAAGWLVWDEPAQTQMADAAVVLDWIRQQYPDTLVFSNARPFGDTPDSYWGGAEVPTGWTYENYLADFASIVQPDIFMYDLYPFTVGGGTQNPFHGAKLVSSASKAADLPYWVFIQAYGDGVNKRIPSESDVRMETFLHLTYGFSGIAYFTYEDAQGPAMVDPNSTPRQIYFDIQEMNPEVFNLGQRIKTLSHRDSYYIAGRTGGASNSAPFNTTSWASVKGLFDLHIRNLSVDFDKPGNNGPGKDGLIGTFRDDAGVPYFMLTNVHHDPNLTAPQTKLDFVADFDWRVKELIRVSRQTGQEETIPLTNGRLEVQLPGGTGDLFRYGTLLESVVLTTKFFDDFEFATDPGYAPGELLNTQNGWNVDPNPAVPIDTGAPAFAGQFLTGPATNGSDATTYLNPAGMADGLDPDRIHMLSWDWKLSNNSHNQAIGFLGSATSFPFGPDQVRNLYWVALDDVDIARLLFEHGSLQESIDFPLTFPFADPFKFEIVVDGVDNVLYGVIDGVETGRLDITDAEIADLQWLQIFTDNGPGRRFPQTDNLLLVEAAPPILGDANNDGQVTGSDLIAVQQNFASAGPANGIFPGDANNDGQVTGADLIIVQQNFGNTLAPVGAEVPEPTLICLLALASLGAMARRRRVAA